MLAENRVSSPGKRRKGWQRGESRVYERRRNIIVVCLAVLQLWVIADSIWQLLRIFEANPDVLFVLTSSISETIYGGRGFSLFFTLLAWAEGVSSKNKTHVPPGLWEQGPPAYCFGIWGRTGRIWPGEILQSGYRQRGREWASAERAGLLYFSRKELRKYSLLHAIICKLFGNAHSHDERKGNWKSILFSYL